MRRHSDEKARALMTERGLIPQVPYPGSHTAWESICQNCGRIVFPMYNTVVNRGSGCRYCTGRLVDPDDAVDLMLSKNLIPQVPYPGAMTKWLCQCKTCDRPVSPTYNSVQRTNQKGGCKYCAGKLVDAKEAQILMISRGLVPQEKFPGSHFNWKCICQTCDRTVYPHYNWVQQGRSGCRYCFSSIPLDLPAILYLITHKEKKAGKIGIGAFSRKRVKEHEKQGWQVFEVWEVGKGSTAYEIESYVLKTLRAEDIPFGVTKEDMPQAGHTETFPLDKVDIVQIREDISTKLTTF